MQRAYHFKYKSNKYKKFGIYTIISSSNRRAWQHWMNYIGNLRTDLILSWDECYETEVKREYKFTFKNKHGGFDLYGYDFADVADTITVYSSWRSIIDVEVS